MSKASLALIACLSTAGCGLTAGVHPTTTSTSSPPICTGAGCPGRSSSPGSWILPAVLVVAGTAVVVYAIANTEFVPGFGGSSRDR